MRERDPVIITNCLDCGVDLTRDDGVVCNKCMRRGLSMSTRYGSGSIRYITCGNVVIHIYKQMIDDKIYLEVEGGDNHVKFLVPIMDADNPARSPQAPDGVWRDHS